MPWAAGNGWWEAAAPLACVGLVCAVLACGRACIVCVCERRQHLLRASRSCTSCACVFLVCGVCCLPHHRPWKGGPDRDGRALRSGHLPDENHSLTLVKKETKRTFWGLYFRFCYIHRFTSTYQRTVFPALGYFGNANGHWSYQPGLICKISCNLQTASESLANNQVAWHAAGRFTSE